MVPAVMVAEPNSPKEELTPVEPVILPSESILPLALTTPVVIKVLPSKVKLASEFTVFESTEVNILLLVLFV